MILKNITIEIAIGEIELIGAVLENIEFKFEIGEMVIDEFKPQTPEPEHNSNEN